MVAEAALGDWADHGGGRAEAGRPDRRAIADRACRALGGFARVFPVARSRALRHRGTWHHLAGEPRRGGTLWSRAAESARQLGLPHDQVLAQFEIYRTLDPQDPEREARWESIRRAADRLGVVLPRH
jgi:hypothetical protein